VLLVAFQLASGPRTGDRYARTMVIWRKFRSRPPFDPTSTACIACGYDLTGDVSGRCPECGRDFAPQAAASPPIAAPSVS